MRVTDRANSAGRDRPRCGQDIGPGGPRNSPWAAHYATARWEREAGRQVVGFSLVRSWAVACSGEVAQLARKLSASWDGEPGSAVKVISVWPGSAVSSSPS